MPAQPSRPSPSVIRVLRRTAAMLFMMLLAAVACVSRRRVLVMVNPAGNMGNQLFLHANLAAFALEHDALLLNPSFDARWRKFFAGPGKGPFACCPPLRLPWPGGLSLGPLVQRIAREAFSLVGTSAPPGRWCAIGLQERERIDLDRPEFVAWLERRSVVLLSGWLFVANESMRRHADEVRMQCRQVSGVDAAALAPLTRLRETSDVVVGVVIRHGDYRQWMGGRFFFETSTYARWIREVRGLFPGQRVGFFICSNDDLDLGEIADARYEFRSRHDLENRAVLARCDYLISPTSTYAGWSAFAGDVPIQVLTSADQTMSRAGFVKITNHTDLRGDSFPDDVNLTAAVTGAGLP